MYHLKNKSIILYDGDCNLCCSSVRFVIRHDHKEHFRFASLQSDAAKEIMLQTNQKKLESDSIVLVQNGRLYYTSDAILLIFKELNHFLRVVYYLKIIPKTWRDALYFTLARRRYKWFGKRSCAMRFESLVAERFLD